MQFEKMIRSLIRNKKITLFFVFLVIAAGTLVYAAMPKQEAPDFTTPYAMITTVFPGASQNDVDAYVTVPINDAVKTVAGYDSSVSYSFNNLSLVVVELKFSADKEAAFRQMKETLAELQADLPDNCGQISVNTNITDTAGIMISLSSNTLTNREVVEQAKLMRGKLSEIDGFARFSIIGNLSTDVLVDVNETKMKTAGLTLAKIVSLIEAGNLDLPVGNITQNGSRITVDYTGGFTGPDDVAALGIGYASALGRVIKLSDIATVTSAIADRNTYYTHNGKQTVILAGYFQEDINVLPLRGEIQDTLDSMTGELPESLEVSLIISQPQEINDSLVSFLRNLLISVGLVILVVLFGMGIKNAVVVSVSLPLSVLLSFVAMYLIRIKIQQISVTALVLSLGMLVDNSIVVSDAIQFELDAGKKRMDACAQGVRSVALPILTSTLTTIAAFAPFIFLNSLAGDYIKSLPQIVCIALAASYLSAVFVIPVLGFIFFRPRDNQKRESKRQSFKRLLEAGLRHRITVIAIVLILLAGSGYLALNLNRIFFPASDKDILYIDVRSDASDDLDGTRDIISGISAVLDGEAGVTEYTAAAGGALPRFNDILYIYTQTPDIGQIMLRVDLDKAGFDTNEDYMADLQQKLDGIGLNARITVKELMYAFPTAADVRVRIIGSDPETLKADEGKVYDVLAGMDGLINISRGNAEFVDTYDLEIDSAAALQRGVVAAQALNEISIAMLGREATSIMDGETSHAVMVTGSATTEDEITAIQLQSSDGSYVSAGDIIALTQSQALSTIPRADGAYAMSVTADYDPNVNTSDLLQSAKEQIEALGLADVKIEYDGEDEKINENFGQVGMLGLAALAVVFVILLLQFKSFRMPMIIFITIPLSVIGSAIGLYITNQPLSFMALLGVVSLLGIVVNNAIILMDYINKQTAAGFNVKTACVNASMRRLRPILLSSITTVIGLIPLAVSLSQLFKPMAVALMSGLLVSTMLTLIVLPVFVSFTQKKARKRQIPR